MKKLIASSLALSALVLACHFGLIPRISQGADSPWDRSRDERSPFSDVRWRGSVPEVKVEKIWYELVAIDNVSIQRIIDACKAADAKDWKKRFEEDLIAVLKRIDVACGETVNLQVKDLRSGGEQTLEHIPMTKENRQAIVKARLERARLLR